ncbi:MAG: glycosyltransferase, partial [Deltaproteobacteria bacterium]|nr:glycosyltransferase [Deltaproteobacteria bacterium]
REQIGKAGIIIGYNNQLAHKIMAGADIFLMPSRYEPCGLTQMYALRYGAVPIVRDTGGLSDTIQQFVPETGEGTGFKFVDYNASSFLGTIKNALKLFQNKKVWTRIVKNGMKADFSWKRSAEEYLKVYQKASAHKD